MNNNISGQQMYYQNNSGIKASLPHFLPNAQPYHLSIDPCGTQAHSMSKSKKRARESKNMKKLNFVYRWLFVGNGKSCKPLQKTV